MYYYMVSGGGHEKKGMPVSKMLHLYELVIDKDIRIA
jgi:hypothetical protein